MRPLPIIALVPALLLAVADAGPDVPEAGGRVIGRVVAVDDGKAVKRDEVWVYLEQLRPRRRHRATSPLPQREIHQHQLQFAPHVLVVPVGTVVAFPNDDDQEHNVFSPTDPPGQFDLGRYNTDRKGKPHVFDDVGEIEIYCDIHLKMWARIKVVDTDLRWIARVQPDGSFAFDGVPPGSYKLHSWSYDSEEVVEPFEVTAGAMVTTREQHLQLGKQHAHTRKDGRPYGPYETQP
jgi:plastocyanin